MSSFYTIVFWFSLYLILNQFFRNLDIFVQKIFYAVVEDEDKEEKEDEDKEEKEEEDKEEKEEEDKVDTTEKITQEEEGEEDRTQETDKFLVSPDRKNV